MKTSSPRVYAKNRCPTINRNLKVFAVNNNSKLDIYLRNSDGSKQYLMTHRSNSILWSLLKGDGMYIDELRRLKLKGPRRMQKSYSSVQHLIKVIGSFCQYDIVA